MLSHFIHILLIFSLSFFLFVYVFLENLVFGQQVSLVWFLTLNCLGSSRWHVRWYVQGGSKHGQQVPTYWRSAPSRENGAVCTDTAMFCVSTGSRHDPVLA